MVGAGVSGYVPIAIKRPWVPEGLFRIATHFLPLAMLLCERPRCVTCGRIAEFYTDGVFECPEHYRMSLDGEIDPRKWRRDY